MSPLRHMDDRIKDISFSGKQDGASYANDATVLLNFANSQSLSRDSNKRKRSSATLSHEDPDNSDERRGTASLLSKHRDNRRDFDKKPSALPNSKRPRIVNVDSKKKKSDDSAANNDEMGMAQILEVLLDREQQQEQQAAVMPSTVPTTVKSMTTLDDGVLDHGTKPLQSNLAIKRSPTTSPPPPPPLKLSEKQMKAAAAAYGLGPPVAAQVSRPSNPVVYLVSHPMPQAVSLSLQPPPQANVRHHRNAGTMYHNISNSTNHITPNSFVNGYNSFNTMNNNNMNNSMFIDVTANTHAVFFGFIRHPGTKEWRDTIKTFSQNFKDYPSWSDDIFEKIRTKLREKGITAYFICRKPHLSQDVREGEVGAAVEKKKIFDKNKNYTGKWDHATGQEILDRTKQRFVDDRKPQAIVAAGAKRPRGRPPKPTPAKPALSDALSHDSDQSSANNVLNLLYQYLRNCRHDIQNCESCHSKGNASPSQENQIQEKLRSEQEVGQATQDHATPDQSETQQIMGTQQKDESVEMDVPKLIELMVELEETKAFVQKKVEEVLDRDISRKAVAIGGTENMEHSNKMVAENDKLDHSAWEGSEARPLEQALSQDRKPFFPILSHHVCFDWNLHPGTVQFREAVKTLAANQIRFPEWTDSFADALRTKLDREFNATTVFLVLLDAQGTPCKSIDDGLWHRATDEEILEKIKQQFDASRDCT